MTQECSAFIFFTWQIENVQVILVNIDGLVAANKFFEGSKFVVSSQNVQIYITNLQIVLNHGHEFISLWFITFKFDQEEPQLAKSHVAQHVKFSRFSIIDNTENHPYCV